MHDGVVRVSDVVGDDAARTLEPDEAEDRAIGQSAGRNALRLGAWNGIGGSRQKLFMKVGLWSMVCVFNCLSRPFRS